MRNTFNTVKNQQVLGSSIQVTSVNDISQNQWRLIGRDLVRITGESDHFIAGCHQQRQNYQIVATSRPTDSIVSKSIKFSYNSNLQGIVTILAVQGFIYLISSIFK